jgi:lipoprotein-anchoring transpeptidase ErfK/SrfK
MGGGRMTAEIGAYELVGVPWTCFFTDDGVAIHGTYWHNDFGITKSSGCINMRNEDAKWIFRWVDPPGDPVYPYRTGYGTKVLVN